MSIIYYEHIDTEVPSRSASSVSVMKMAAAFAAGGARVTLFTRGDNEQQLHIDSQHSWYGVPESFRLHTVKPLLVSGGRRRSYAKAFAACLRDFPVPDVIYGRNPFALLATQRHHCRIIYESHAWPEGAARRAEAWLFRRPDFSRLVVISEALRCRYEHAFEHDLRGKVVVARIAANQRPHDNAAIRPIEFTNGRIQVGYIGSLYEGRGIDIIIQSARRLPRLDFHVFGGYPDELRKWGSAASGIGNLCFHGHVSPAEVARTLDSLDILLAPYQEVVRTRNGVDTTRWASPLKVAEYMAAGKAIVASDLPMIREILTHDKEAILVPPASLPSWVETLRALADDSTRRRRLGAMARERQRRELSWTARVGLVLG